MIADRVSRRALLQAALAGGALTVAAQLPGCADPRARRIRHADRTGELTTGAFLTILPSGVVAMTIDKAEIGQGVATAYATLVAEELEVEPGDIDLHLGDALPEFRTLTQPGVPGFAVQATGGSTSVAQGYQRMRRLAAAAREVLIAAAAARWGVAPRACRAEAGAVHHPDTGRRLGYGELTRDAARHPLPDDPPLKPSAQLRLIGKHGARVDGYAKVTGTATFGIDVVVPGMVCAAAIHGPQFGARPRAVRADAARRSPGVIDVLTLPWGVAVVADKFWQAQRAARLVEVDWHAGATAGLDSAAMLAAARAHTAAGAPARDDGDVAAAFGRGAHRVDAVYQVPFLAHAALEPQNCVASVRGGKAELWAPCQSPSGIQEGVATALGLDPDDVVVHSTFVGGGFGRRLLGDYAVQAATISRAVGRPVKLIWDRASDLTQAYYRPAAVIFMRGAVDAAGRATALDYHNLSQSIAIDAAGMLRDGMPRWLPAIARHVNAQTALGLTAANTVVDMFATEGAHNTPYRIADLRVAYTPIHTGLPVASWRSVGNSFNAFAIEGLIDELAHAAGADPYQFRRAHLADGSRERRVLDAVAGLARWGQRPPPGHAWGIARHTAFDTECAEIAEVTIRGGRICVTRVWCAVECGLVVNPDLVRAQLEGGIVFGLSAALDQQITLVDGVVRERSFDQFPPLRMFEAPRIEVTIVASDAPPTGVGEPGVPPIAPAVASAVFALTGTRLRTLPLQRALQEAHR